VTSYFAKDPTELGLSVSAIVWREHEILLMRRSDNGYWGLPGGFVELGESVAEAARREVVEETGWEVEIGRLIGVYSDPAHQVVDYGPIRKGPIRKGPIRKGPIRKGPIKKGPISAERDGAGAGDQRIQVVNLCCHAKALSPGEPTTPDETLEMGFFPANALPEPFVPIHLIRVEDGLAGHSEASVR
jgi:NUDIX domain